MATYDSIIDRSDIGALIPEDVSRSIIQGLPAASVALTSFRRATMSRAQQRLPVLSVLPVAYWVDGDTGLKQTTEQHWANQYLDARELAVIVPIPQAVLDDIDFDIWGEVRPRLVEAFGVKIDAAAIFGTDKPAGWPDSIVEAAVAAGNVVEVGESTGDIAADVNLVMGKVEEDGFDVSGFWARRAMKAAFRGLRDANGQPIFQPSLTAGTPGTLYGESILWISTAGVDAPGILVELHASMFDGPGELEDRGSLLIYRDRANGVLIWWYGAPRDADIEDPAVWLAANPASWLRDGTYLAQEYARLKARGALLDWRRYHLNQFVGTEEAGAPEERCQRAVSTNAKLVAAVTDAVVNLPAPVNEMALQRIKRRREEAADRVLRDRDYVALEATMDALDAEEAEVRATVEEPVTPREVADALSDMRRLFRKVEPRTQQRIAQALFKKVEVLGPLQVWVQPSDEAEAQGWASAMYGAFEREVRSYGRGERSRGDTFQLSVSIVGGGSAAPPMAQSA